MWSACHSLTWLLQSVSGQAKNLPLRGLGRSTESPLWGWNLAPVPLATCGGGHPLHPLFGKLEWCHRTLRPEILSPFWQREKNALLYLAQAGGWEREGRLSVRFIEPQSALVLNTQFIPFHTTKPFFYSGKCCHLDEVRKILVSTVGPFLQSHLRSGSLGRLLLLCDNFSLKTVGLWLLLGPAQSFWRGCVVRFPVVLSVHWSLLFPPGGFQSLCNLEAIKGNVKGREQRPNLLTRGSKGSVPVWETLYCKHIDFACHVFPFDFHLTSVTSMILSRYVRLEAVG